ncbi:MAG: hypothetical protein EA398_01860 [Deltaproteobacteria bacterium]|nr:MAG: hypothetical protein EA398_01860 [Deltaproteobacteria bacterium]
MDGCLVNADCTAGMFCYQMVCVVECRTDGECGSGEVCSERGQCLAGDAQKSGREVPARPTAVSDLEFRETPEPTVTIAPGQLTVAYRIALQGAIPEGGILYRIERNDGLNRPEELLHVRPDSEGNIEIPLEVGEADPDGENAAVTVRVHLPFGNARVVLVPRQPAAGQYVGQVRMDGFGSTGLPIELKVFTSPDRASLADADEAWLALRVAREHLFAPVDGFDPDREWVRSPLVYNEFVQRWVATFDHEFRLGEDSRLSAYEPGQVRRQMRFELDAPEDGLIIGRMSDRWSGLFVQRSSQGAPEVGIVRYEGDVEVEWQEVVLLDDLPSVLEAAPAAPGLLAEPGLSSCEGVTFPQGDEDSEACEGIETVADFLGADLAERFSCARALADEALAGETTASQILAFLDEEIDNPRGLSFAQFMEMCASGEDGVCEPSQEVLCGRQLLAASFHAFGNATSAEQGTVSGQASGIIRRYQEVSREAFLGRQLGAFQTDVNTRLAWLRDSQLPAIVTAVVQSRTEELLNDWQANVLDVHMATLTGQFDDAGLVVLGAAASGAEALSARRRLLAETVQSWRGAMDALVLAAQRWDALLQDEFKREEKAEFVAGSIRDLYLMAGMLYQFNLEAGAGFQNASLAGGFGNLLRQLNRLSLSFEELVFARDAEVVTSNSLNPLEDNDSLLNRLRRDAERELADASESIEAILDQTQAEALSETQLRQGFQSTITSLRSELAELCGIPVGCSAEEARTVPECSTPVEAGLCGFAIERGTEEYLPYNHANFAVSEGGRAQLELLTALQGVSIAQAELNAFYDRARLEFTELERFAEQIELWNVRRLDRIGQMRANFAQRDSLRSENMQVLFANLDSMAETRQGDIASFQNSMNERNLMRIGNATLDFAMAAAQLSMRSTASALTSSITLKSDLAKAVAEGMPKSAGTSNDATAPARGAVLAKGAAITFGMRASAIALNQAADRIQLAQELRNTIRGAELALAEDRSTLSSMVAANELAELQEEIQRSDALTAAELALLEETLQLILAESEAQEAYERDRDTYLQRRLAHHQRLTEGAELALRIDQAIMRYEQRMMEYLQIVQRAQLIDAQIDEVEAQLNDIEVLIGSPAAVFSRANRLAQAESRLDRAKSAIMDWLVALEYFAVRPFMDQRIQILLARNTFQLEAIVAEMRRIENSCGGAINESDAVFSVRNDFLELVNVTEDVLTGQIITPEERFRAVLEEGVVPVDKRVRYSTDSNIGELMRTDAGILAATFTVNLNDWANLATSCNAKVTGVRIQLVGEGLGDARPTVSLLYDGTAQLRSCQPGVDALVASFGPGVSSFGSITTLRTRGRSISPTAGLNDFPGNANRTLAGLPLSSQYTVLINPNIGENRNINWENLEDIRIEFGFGYQDLFPVGQCE